MKLIKPYFEILPQSEGLEGIYKQIELAGRTCYKSEDKITEDSAKGFVDRMITSNHLAMCEHGTVYLYVEYTSPTEDFIKYNEGIEIKTKYSRNKYSKVTSVVENNYKTKCYITTNLRVLVENVWLDDLKYLCEPTEHHEKRYTVKFITDQGILREFTRHRTMSFACESTRYCNYSKSKFGEEITFIEPCWEMDVLSRDIFISHLLDAESHYMALLNAGWKPQQARNILPLATKCDLIMTGFTSDWEHFFSLRTPVNAHPQARELAIPLKEEFISLNYISKDS